MPYYTDAMLVGEATFSRLLSGGSQTMTPSVLRLAYFTAEKTETITQTRWYSSATAAGATPTLVRFAVYSEDADSNGALTLLASTVNDTAIFAAANTAYLRSFSASFNKVAGRRYACGALVVTGATAPTIQGISNVPATLSHVFPRLTTSITAQSDLPTSISSATVAASAAGAMGYCELLP